MICLIRCDDRLIHGQCIFRVLNDYKVRRILLIDDMTASNPTLRNIYVLAAPPGVKTEVLTTQGAVEKITGAIKDDVSTLILFKHPGVALELYSGIDDLKKELNIGPMSNRSGTKKVTMFSHLTSEEIRDLEKLHEFGVRVYFQQVNDEKATEWKDVRKELLK